MVMNDIEKIAHVRAIVEKYTPLCAQEARDREQMLRFMGQNQNCLTRENVFAHMTASAWVVDPARGQALMIFHNLYRSWAWTGGHADGECDLRAVAVREAEEETGVLARPASDRPLSLESLCVEGHVKRGAYVSAHIHLNVSYLLIADPEAPVRHKPDENSGVLWVPFEEVNGRCSEPFMRVIYQKLMDRARANAI